MLKRIGIAAKNAEAITGKFYFTKNLLKISDSETFFWQGIFDDFPSSYALLNDAVLGFHSESLQRKQQG